MKVVDRTITIDELKKMAEKMYNQVVGMNFPCLNSWANIGTDVDRAIRWRKRDRKEESQAAFERALELMYLTIADPKNRKRLKELVRAKELFIDYFLFENTYGFTDEYWRDYYYWFGYAAALQRGR